MRSFGWSYDYLLWGISWLNLQLMIADAPRTKEMAVDVDDNVFEEFDDTVPTITSKEDIKNFLKQGLL